MGYQFSAVIESSRDFNEYSSIELYIKGCKISKFITSNISDIGTYVNNINEIINIEDVTKQLLKDEHIILFSEIQLANVIKECHSINKFNNSSNFCGTGFNDILKFIELLKESEKNRLEYRVIIGYS